MNRGRMRTRQPDQGHAHEQALLRGLRENGRFVGAPADVPYVRARGLLRLVAEPARNQALQDDRPSVDSIDRAGESWMWCYVDNVVPAELEA